MSRRNRRLAVKDITEQKQASLLLVDQPCFYGCGTLLPMGCDAASTALRRAHLDACPCCLTAPRRPLVNERRDHTATIQGV